MSRDEEPVRLRRLKLCKDLNDGLVNRKNGPWQFDMEPRFAKPLSKAAIESPA